MMPTIGLFGLVLPVPALTLLAGLWLGLTTAERFCQQSGLGVETLYNAVFILLGASLLTARLFYIAAYPQFFLAEPLSLISPSPGLLDPWGAAAGGLVGLLIYAKKARFSIPSFLDALTPALAVFAIAFHLANLASGSGFGSPSSLPGAINLFGALRHPVQVYEAAAASLILALLWKRWNQPAQFAGQNFLIFAALSAAARLIFEYFHGDSLLIANSLRAVQIGCWLVLAACLYWLTRRADAAGPNS